MTFSLFIPVHNGMPYICECVESVLAMHNQDFELNVLDNASSDGTYEWLMSLKDSRLSVSRSHKKLSIEESWARVCDFPNKRAFMTILGHDDVVAPTFLDDVHHLITSYPEASLYSIGVKFINSEGKFLRDAKMLATGVRSSTYLKSRLQFKSDMFGSGFVFSSASYQAVGGIPRFKNLLFADDVLWLKLLGKHGWLASSEKRSCKVRLHDRSASASNPEIWPDLILGLNSFKKYLDEAKGNSAENELILESLLGSFMARYHANATIYAYVESALEKRTDMREKLLRIQSSLDECSPMHKTSIQQPIKVQVVGAMYRLGFFRLISILWKIFWMFKRT